MTVESKPLVLFLCTGNSARSILAEAILRDRAGDRFRVASAGLEPKGVNPLTLEVLKEAAIDVGGLQSKNSAEFLGRVSVRHAIILCESAQQSCPRIYPFATQTLYWPFDDPAAAKGTHEDKLAKFREVREQIGEKIDEWLAEVPAV